MANQFQVIELHQKYPQWRATQIASRLGCSSEYVRATAARKGITLNGSWVTKPPKPESLVLLGRACRAAGLTLADIRDIAETVNT